MILKEIHKDDYCARAEQSLGVFASSKWLSIYDQLTFVGIFKDEHQIVGGFYYLKIKKNGFTFFKLPPYTPHCGLFFVNDSKNKSSRNNYIKEIITDVCLYFSKLKPSLIVVAFPSSVIDLQPFIWSKFKVIPNYTYRIDLTKPFDEIKSQFDSKNRNAINKAIKQNVVVIENALKQNELHEFFKQSLKTTNANVYAKELENIFSKFAISSNSFSFTAKHNNEVVGNVFCIYDSVNCYYLLGGVNKASGIQGINNILVEKSIEKAQLLGCSVFDFEGSMLKGVEKFFRGFGGELFPYFTVNKASLPIEMILKFKKRELF